MDGMAVGLALLMLCGVGIGFVGGALYGYERGRKDTMKAYRLN